MRTSQPHAPGAVGIRWNPPGNGPEHGASVDVPAPQDGVAPLVTTLDGRSAALEDGMELLKVARTHRDSLSSMASPTTSRGGPVEDGAYRILFAEGPSLAEVERFSVEGRLDNAPQPVLDMITAARRVFGAADRHVPTYPGVVDAASPEPYPDAAIPAAAPAVAAGALTDTSGRAAVAPSAEGSTGANQRISTVLGSVGVVGLRREVADAPPGGRTSAIL